MIILQNILNENIVNPFRSGKVSIKIGTTTYKNLNHDFIMLDNMEWLFKLKPSFVILLPKNSDITKKNSKLNVEIIYPKQASTKMNFNIVSSGSADLNTYFFGNEKEDRSFDFYYRFFETGFTLTNFQNLEKSPLKFSNNTKLSISSQEYRHPSIVTGDTNGVFSVNARLNRIN